MPATPSTTPAVETSEIDALRQQLTAADRKRRELLVALFLKHGGDTGPIIDLLFADVPAATLDRIESMLPLFKAAAEDFRAFDRSMGLAK